MTFTIIFKIAYWFIICLLFINQLLYINLLFIRAFTHLFIHISMHMGVTYIHIYIYIYIYIYNSNTHIYLTSLSINEWSFELFSRSGRPNYSFEPAKARRSRRVLPRRGAQQRWAEKEATKQASRWVRHAKHVGSTGWD